MPDIEDGETAHVQGSAKDPYELKNVGGVYSCTCPAWRNQGTGIERRTCKHLRQYRGEEAETERLAAFGTSPAPAAKAKSSGGGGGRAVKKATAPPVLLAHKWENDVDLTGWWMSEKLDGVRAWWNGQEFLSRNGNVFQAPDWFVETLPKHPLDGELWVGRKMFQDTMSVVRRYDKSDDWKKVRYVLFDAPEINGAFEARFEFLQKNFARGAHEFTHVLEHERVRDMKHLKDELARVEGLGGEGLMVRKPGSKYVNGRSDSLLKIKSFFDAEAKVVGHTAGTGRHKGRLGALDVVLPDGTKFQVGTGFSDAERDDPPAIGSIVTFRYQELSDGGVPRFPSYVGIRDDIDWPEAGAKKEKDEPVRKAVNPKNPRGPAPKPAKLVADGGKPAGGGKRMFEFSEGASNKFWEIWIDGNEVYTRYGRIGSNGQTTVKDQGSPAGAKKLYDKLVAEKTGKGYEEK